MTSRADAPDTALFLYGTLRHAPLLAVVAGDSVTGQEATLPDHAVYRVRNADYPMIAAAPGAVTKGLLVRLSREQRARLDFYEGGHGYALRQVTVLTAQGPVAAQVYWPPREGPGADGAWSLGDWVARRGALQRHAARFAMALFGRQSPQRVARRFPTLLARAQAHLNAQDAPPTTLRRMMRPGDVEIDWQVVAYADFFSVEDVSLQHRTFDGGMTAPLKRAAFVSADAVTVLPYDLARDRVLLVEQFRVGPLMRGDPQPWSLEAIAGRIDPGETPEDAARRETLEEAGLDLSELLPLGGHYASPGAKTEFLFCFIGIADLPDGAAGLGGLAHEGEDIRAHVIGFDRLMALLDSGEAGNGPLILSALHLARMRDRLRAG